MLMYMVHVWSGTPKIHFSCLSGISAFASNGVALPWLTRARLGNAEYLAILTIGSCASAPGFNGIFPELAALLSCCLCIVEDMICIDQKHAPLIVEKDKPLAGVKSVHYSCHCIDGIAWSSNPFATRTRNVTTAVGAAMQDG
jgi:hypothetical protein